MATYPSILAWRIPWTKEPGELVHRVAKSWTRLTLSFTFFTISAPNNVTLKYLKCRLFMTQGETDKT